MFILNKPKVHIMIIFQSLQSSIIYSISKMRDEYCFKKENKKEWMIYHGWMVPVCELLNLVSQIIEYQC